MGVGVAKRGFEFCSFRPTIFSVLFSFEQKKVLKFRVKFDATTDHLDYYADTFRYN